MDLHELTIHEAHDRLKSGDLSSRKLTESVLRRIETVDDRVGAYISVCADDAMAAAEEADKTIKAGKIASPLTGIPMALKDLICTKGIRTTCASKVLENFVPPYNATVAEKLKAAGIVLVGKTNMDEFAMGSTNENSGFKPTKNPWRLDRVPGGSSGGSAAAVAADECIAAVGSDTGGSIRQPASHCGIVGMKPTYGRVSRFGLVAFASSLDQIGPMTKDVTDCALMMNALSGYDPKDSTSVPEGVPDYTRFLTDGLKGMTVGIPAEYHRAEGLNPEVAKVVEGAVARMKEMGATCVDISLPHTPYVVAVYYVIAPCEASSNLARYDGVKYGFRDTDAENLIGMYRQTRSAGFGQEVQRRIIIGTYALSAGYYDAYYKKASQVRTLIREDFNSALETCDVILAPVAPAPAPKIGEVADDPLAMYLSDIFTLSANLAGIPGISVPGGFSSEGLPIGVQLMGKHFREGDLLKAAYNLEKSLDLGNRKPEL